MWPGLTVSVSVSSSQCYVSVSSSQCYVARSDCLCVSVQFSGLYIKISMGFIRPTGLSSVPNPIQINRKHCEITGEKIWLLLSLNEGQSHSD